MSLLQPCLERIDRKSRRKRIDKLLAAEDWFTLYTSKYSGAIVLSESDYVEHKHELQTAASLADKGFNVLFAPKGMFGREQKRFDIFLIKNDVLLDADLKCITSKNPDTIADRIIGGSKQASRIVVEIASDIEKKNLIQGLRSGIYKNSLVKEILLFYNRVFYVLPVNLIGSNKIYDVIK